VPGFEIRTYRTQGCFAKHLNHVVRLTNLAAHFVKTEYGVGSADAWRA